MKSKMKLAFALIAIALMIMVAVVPMVSVFTSDSDATPTLVPSATSQKIKVSGKLYTYAGAVYQTSNTYVKLTWGDGKYYAYSSAVNTSTGAYEINIDDTSVSTGKLTVWTSTDTTTYTQVNTFNEITITGLVANKEYTADLREGTIQSGAVTLAFKNSTAITVAGVLADATIPVSFSYEIWAGASAETATKVSTNSLTFKVQGFTTNDTYIYYPYYSTGFAYIKVLSVTVGTTQYTTMKNAGLTNTISTSATTIQLDQYVAKVTSTSNMPKASLTIEDATYFYSNIIGGGVDSNNAPINAAYFISETAFSSPSAKATWSSAVADSTAVALSAGDAPSYTYTPTGRYFGNVTMTVGGTAVSAYDTQAVTITYGTNGTETSLLVVSSNGFYVTSGKAGDTDKVKIVLAGGFALSTIGGLSIDENGIHTNSSGNVIADSADIVVTPAGYQLVQVKAETDVTATLAGATNVFGVPYSSSAKSGSLSLTSDYLYLGVVKGNVIKVTPSNASTVSYKTGISEVQVAESVVTIDITTNTQTIKFKLTDGDGTQLTTTQLRVNYKYGSATTYTAVANTATGITISTIPGWVTLTDILVYVDYQNTPTDTYLYSFAAKDGDTAVKYSPVNKVMTIASLDKTYSVSLEDANGNMISVSATQANMGLTFYNAYVNEGGYTIFRAVTTPTTAINWIGLGADGSYTYMTSSAVIDKTITTTTQKVAAFCPEGVTGYIWSKTPVVATTDLVITASADSITAKLVRNDGVTPIAGAIVKLYSASTNATTPNADTYQSTTVTAADGTFTLTSNVELTYNSPRSTDSVITYQKAGYNGGDVQVAYAMETATEKYSTYMFSSDLYLVMIEDADESYYDYSWIYKTQAADTGTKALGKLTVDKNPTGAAATVEVTGYSFSALLTEGQLIKADLKKDANASGEASSYTIDARTFANHAITADEIASGMIEFTTQEREYVLNVEDAAGKAINVTATQLFAVEMNDGQDIAVIDNTKVIGSFNKESKGVYSVVLTDLPSGEYYAVKSTETGDYKFSAADRAEFKDGIATLESLYATVTVKLTDADGNEIEITDVPKVRTGAAGTYVYTAVPIVTTIGIVEYSFTPSLNVPANTLSFIGFPYADYYFDEDAYIFTTQTAEASDYTYSFSDDTELDDGEFAADQKTIVFTFTDALGEPLEITVDVTPYKGEDIQDKILDDAKTNAEGQISVITSAFGSSYKYKAESAGLTFEMTSDLEFVADQTVLVPSFVTANGVELEPTAAEVSSVKAYGLSGVEIATAAGGIIVVDLADVAYFRAVSEEGYDYTFDDAALPVFVANESLITGTIPATENVAYADQYMVLHLYLGQTLVGSVEAEIDEDYQNTYSVALPLGDYIGTAGMSFDSIVGVYTESGVIIATGAIDPYTAINNIYTPEQQSAAEYDVYDQTSGPGALYSQAYVVNNNLLVLSATPVFYISDEGYYVDGQYKYVFAGWFVDGVKVSANADYAMNIEADVVVAAQYDVTYEKISDANKDVEKEYVNVIQEVPVEKESGLNTNVLIIGICAVIVALIAVVYAVIKKE